jgi:hypothetical protein
MPAKRERALQRWEYAILSVILRSPYPGLDTGVFLNTMRRPELENLPMDQMLNAFGDEGWELAATSDIVGGTVYYLTRPKP